MKTTEVRILTALEAGESYLEPTFLLVETALDEAGELGEPPEPVTRIDHVTSSVIDGEDTWTITTLGQSVPMTHSAALEWALSYAASRDIPIVYERDDTRNTDYAATPSEDLPATASTSK